MNYEDKLEKLRLKYPDDESKNIVSGWQKSLKLASLTANLRDHDGMKLIIHGMEKELEKITHSLVNDEALFKDSEGQILGRILHARRKWIKDFLKIFENAEKQIAGINNLINNKLLHENQDN